MARIPACEATGWEFVRLYEIRAVGAVRYPCSEVEAGLWMAPEEVEAWTRRRPQDFASGFLECWSAFQAAREG